MYLQAPPGSHYRIGRRLVPTASQAAGSVLWEARNPSSTLLTVITTLRMRVLQIANPTAAIEQRFSLTRTTGHTVLDTTGGAAISPASGKQKLRSSYADAGTLVSESSSAAGLSGGAKTADPQPISTNSIWVGGTVSAAYAGPVDIFDLTFDMSRGEFPLVLAQNEGFQITNDALLGAAAGTVFLLAFQWMETATFT